MMETMKILYAASEARPFATSGGLADVAEALPKALVKKGVDCRVVLPLYNFKIDEMKPELREKIEWVKTIDVPVAWKRVFCGIHVAKHNGVTYYFIENEEYFKEPPMYGKFNDLERFAFFSRAVLDMLPHIDFKPDVIVANDWQCALVPIYQSVLYKGGDFYRDIKTAFCIHNMKHQGKCGLYKHFDTDMLTQVFGLPEWTRNTILEWGGAINLFKGALETADRIITVSPRYAQEISETCFDPADYEVEFEEPFVYVDGKLKYDFGEGLAPILKKNSWKVSGIVNGIGENFNPEIDSNVYKKFDITTFKEGKKANKKALQEEFGLEIREDVPLIGIVGRIDYYQKGFRHLLNVLATLLDENDIQIAFLGDATPGEEHSEGIQNGFIALANRHSKKFGAKFGRFDPVMASKINAAADITSVPSLYEPCGLTQLIALKYGTIPVVRETGGLADTIKDSGDGKGNGFTFAHYTYGDLKHAFERALDGYSNKQGWNTLVKRAIACNFSWDNSVNLYIELYKKMIRLT